jgi:hypothetical protein
MDPIPQIHATTDGASSGEAYEAAKAKEKARAASAKSAKKEAEQAKRIIEGAELFIEVIFDQLKRRHSDKQVKKLIIEGAELIIELIMSDQQVKKIIYERLLDDRRTWKQGELEVGSKYYAKVRSEYSNPDNLEGKLKPTNNDELAILQCFGWLLDPVQLKELKQKIGTSLFISKKGGDVSGPAAKKAKTGCVFCFRLQSKMVALLFKQ